MSTLYHVTIPNMASTVRIVGRVSRDAESRFTPNGTQVTNVSMAVSRRYNQDGEWKETAQFVQIAVWGDAAIRAQGIKKGDVVVVFSMADMEARPYTTKGIIHCHSYALGQKIYDYFRSNKRVLFSTKASERAANFNLHRISPAPTVMLSPSISEGFSFDDDLARFQIIAKVPYPYLGDRQIAARMKLDRDWYTLQTVMTILQACGRIVRSDTDHGSTYILDRDFLRLFEENTKFFPKWFKDGFKFY